jgi:hypothetical protein
MSKREVTIRMPKDILAKWLAALRSGEYRQTNRFMHNRKENSFCCLGVLQDSTCGKIVEAEDEYLPAMEWIEQYCVHFFDKYGGRSADPFLPALQKSAAGANDGGATFAEIADAIEACAEGF